jgi:enamine deaminase RidA (YjgF/YER057c/UK114 family)
MTLRRSIRANDIPEHRNPIPAATLIGNMLFTSALWGQDPDTFELPAEKEAQFANAFSTMKAVMREAGGTVEDIGKVTVYLADKSDRKLINPLWLEMFPDEDSRPARHTIEQSLPSGCFIQVEFIAVLADMLDSQF